MDALQFMESPQYQAEERVRELEDMALSRMQEEYDLRDFLDDDEQREYDYSKKIAFSLPEDKEIQCRN